MGKVMDAAHHIVPGLVEAGMRKDTQKTQYDTAAPDASTDGGVLAPMAKGTEVKAGMK